MCVDSGVHQNQTPMKRGRLASRVATRLVMTSAMALSCPCDEAPYVVWPVWWSMCYCFRCWLVVGWLPPLIGVRADSPEALLNKMRCAGDGCGTYDFMTSKNPKSLQQKKTPFKQLTYCELCFGDLCVHTKSIHVSIQHHRTCFVASSTLEMGEVFNCLFGARQLNL